MLAIKGFISHALMARNTPGQNALIAELSTYAATYAKDKGYYGTVNAQHYKLTTFLAERDGAAIELAPNAVENVLTIAKFILDKTINSASEIYADELLVELGIQFAASADDFSSGPIVNDGRYYAPEWVSWHAKGLADADNYIRIWFVDSAFRLQYDEFDITIIPPLAVLNDFFLAGGTVETKLNARTLAQQVEMMQVAKNSHPETVMRIETYEYINPQNPAHRLPTNWGILVYGEAGNNPDSIKDALIAYILANSTHTREEWTPILPDIFKRTEFMLLPRWDRYAIENRTLEAGIHTPYVNAGEARAFARDKLDYPDAHINSHAGVFAHPYKALTVVSVGGPENRDNKWELTDFYPDYLNVPSTSTDFNRMSLPTRDFALALDLMIQAAETVKEFNSVPLGMSKTKRDGILYVVKSLGNVHYLVAAKSSIAPDEA